MPMSSANASAVSQILEVARSSDSASEKLDRVLDLTREALCLESLSLVACGHEPEIGLHRHSSANGAQVDVVRVESAAREAISNGATISNDGLFAAPIDHASDFPSAIVGLGSGDVADSTLLLVATGLLALLMDNQALAGSIAESENLSRLRMQEIATIYEIGQAMDPTDVGPVLDMIVEKAAAVMDAQTCSLMLRDHHDGALVIEASFGLAEDVVKGARISFGEGIAGTVAATAQPMLICDVSTDPRLKRHARPRPGVICSMCVPLKDEDGNVVGILSIRRHDPKPRFTDDDLQLFGVFATHAALAVSNAQLYSRLHRKAQEMATISDVLRAINSTLDLEDVLKQIVESITDVVGFDRCCLYLLDARSNEFVAGARRGYDGSEGIRDRIQGDDGIVGLAARERIPIFAQESPVDQRGAGSPGEYLVAPIVVRDQCIGVVVVDNLNCGKPIEPADVDLLATFVSQAGIAVENARLYEAMEEKYAELNVLYDHSKSISAAYGVDNAAGVLVDTASRAIRSDGAGLLLLDLRRGRLRLQASSAGLAKSSERIDLLARGEQCVEFVRNLRSATLVASGSAAAYGGAVMELLESLAPGQSNLILAPLVAEDTTIGVLALYRGRGDDFQSAELKLTSIVTSHAATVLKNAMSYEQKMRQRVLELTALYEFSKKISSASKLEEALDSILAIVADLVDYDESFIYTVDHERQAASVRSFMFRGEPGDGPPDEPLEGDGVVSWSIRERKALVSPDISHDPRFREQDTRVRSMMSIPLIV